MSTQKSIYRFKKDWSPGVLQQVSGPGLKKPNRIVIGGKKYAYQIVGKGPYNLGHGMGSGLAIVGFEIAIDGLELFVSGDRFELAYEEKGTQTMQETNKETTTDPNALGYAAAMGAAAAKLEELGAANGRLKLALLAFKLSPAVVAAIEKGE